MKYAADFRRIAREALSGKWMIAVLVGLVATLLGGAGSGGPELKLNIDASGAHANFQFAGQTIFSTGGGLNSDIGAFLVGSAIYITIADVVMAVVYFRPCSASSPIGRLPLSQSCSRACMSCFGHCSSSSPASSPPTATP